MSEPQSTDERLKSWLNSHQSHRERLCLALLSLIPQYTNVRPRLPEGGPDGGRDMEALYDRQFETWGAVGFLNSATDSRQDKKQISRKFNSDLESALKQKADLKGFVFFTNVRLSPAEKEQCLKEAKAKGILHVEIFDREVLRHLLDTTEGLAIRFRYLRINLTDAEQIAFFAKFGSQLEQLITEKFNTVDQKLARLEFLSQLARPLFSMGVIIELNGDYTYEELGSHRFLFQIGDDSLVHDSVLMIGSRHWIYTFEEQGQKYSMPCIETLAMIDDLNTVLFKDELPFRKKDRANLDMLRRISSSSSTIYQSLSGFDRKYGNRSRGII